jgi:hypothetical protein
MNNKKFMEFLKRFSKEAERAVAQGHASDYFDAMELADDLLRKKHGVPRAEFTIEMPRHSSIKH